VKSDGLFDILPKFYGGRLSLKEDNDEADEDAVLLMENLNISGYYCMDRLKGLDLEHAKLAITGLARFHALGIALKHKQPDLFEEAKEVLRLYPFKPEDSQQAQFEEMIEYSFNLIYSDPRIAKYVDRVKEKSKIRFDYLQNIVIDEPWSSIIHGDFWVNNIMYHKENGEIDGVKFVDFQITQASSPLKDLPYFLCASVSMDVIDNHFDDLIAAYHSSFIEVLEKIGCDVAPFAKDKFDKQLKKDASDELFRCLMALKVFTLEPSADLDLNQMDTQIFGAKGSNLYMDRACKVVLTFAEKGWL